MPVFNDDVLNPYGRMYNQLRKAADPNYSSSPAAPARPCNPRTMSVGATVSETARTATRQSLQAVSDSHDGLGSKVGSGVVFPPLQNDLVAFRRTK